MDESPKCWCTLFCTIMYIILYIKGQIGREVLMRDVSIEYTGRPSKIIGRRNIQAKSKKLWKNY